MDRDEACGTYIDTNQEEPRGGKYISNCITLRSGTATKKTPTVQKLDPNTLLIIPLQFSFKTFDGL